MLAFRTTAAVLLLICAGAAQQIPARPTSPASTDPSAEAAERGRDLTAHACASCHATGRTGASPMPEATPFRVIVNRYPLDRLEEGFAEGLVTVHPAMPAFLFRASEIDDLIAYLDTVRAEP